nr:MAG TPA: hypothetical protein [Caudoviricetes sp.]
MRSLFFFGLFSATHFIPFYATSCQLHDFDFGIDYRQARERTPGHK